MFVFIAYPYSSIMGLGGALARQHLRGHDKVHDRGQCKLELSTVFRGRPFSAAIWNQNQICIDSLARRFHLNFIVDILLPYERW